MLSSGVFGCAAVCFCLMVLLTNEACATFELKILHTNDIHARVQEINKYKGICKEKTSQKDECFGGFARIKTKVDELKAKFPNTIFVDGGDQYQGTLWFYLYGGQVMSHLMNLVGYDAMGLGNHEFDSGPEGLEPFLQNVTFPVLSCNIDASSYPKLKSIKKSVVIKRSGQKIGIIGYTTTETPFISNPKNIAFEDEITSIQKQVNELKKRGVNKIIAIGHAGYKKDKEIATKVTGLDVIVGGHSNTFLYKGKQPSSEKPVADYPTVVTNNIGKKVLVVQDFAFGKYLGELNVKFSNCGSILSWNGNPILLDHTVKRDPAILNTVKAYLPGITLRQKETIGTTLFDIIGDRSICRRYECNMGNLITDAMVRENMRHADGMRLSRVTIAVVNSGGIRSDLMTGEITIADVLHVQPFRNTVDIIVITGKTIKGMLEHSVANRDEAEGWGGFLQVSGLRVVFDKKKPVGSQVHRVDVLCSECSVPEYKPLNETEEYKVLIINYLRKGADGYKIIKDNIISEHTIGNLDVDILMDYIKDNTPIMAGLDGRIRFLEDTSCEQIVKYNRSLSTS